MKTTMLAICFSILAGLAAAEEVVFSVGGSDASLGQIDDVNIAELEYWSQSGAGPGFAGVFATQRKGASFLGGSATYRAPLNDRWFVDGALGAGLVVDRDDGDATAFGVRGMVALGREIGGNTRVSIGLSQVESGVADFGSITLRLHGSF